MDSGNHTSRRVQECRSCAVISLNYFRITTWDFKFELAQACPVGLSVSIHVVVHPFAAAADLK
jgi:hypothetical protein